MTYATSDFRGVHAMQEIAKVLSSAGRSTAERKSAIRAFIRKRAAIWQNIREGNFPENYVSASGRKYVGAPRRTAIRCEFLLASKLALGAKYAKDRIADSAQRDLLFYVLRDREAFPGRNGKKFYCCPQCTGKLYECVNAGVFRYIDNAKWKAAIQGGK